MIGPGRVSRPEMPPAAGLPAVPVKTPEEAVKPQESRPRTGARSAAWIGRERGGARLFYLACLVVFLYGAASRVALQNVYARTAVDALALAQGDTLAARLRWAFHQTYYPPLHDSLVTLGASLVGATPRAVIRLLWIVPLATSLLIAAFYRERGHRRSGWVVGGVYLLLPFVWRSAVFPVMDCTSTVFLAASFLFLERASRSRRLRDEALAGLSLGLGMMTKWTFGVFAGPWAIAHALCGLAPMDRPTRTGRWARPAVLSLSFLAVTLPWYATRANWVSFAATATNDADILAGVGRFRVVRFLGEMLAGLHGTAAGVVGAAAIGVALAAVLAQVRPGEKGAGRALGFVLSAVVLPLVVLSRMPHLEGRYLAPLCVTLVLTPAFATEGWLARFLTVTLVAILGVFSVVRGVVPDLSACRAVRSDPRHVRTAWHDPAADDVLAWFGALVKEERELTQGLTAHPIYRSSEIAWENSLILLLHQAGRIPAVVVPTPMYPGFVADLGAGRAPRYLLTDCNGPASCAPRHRGLYDYLVLATGMDRPYVMPTETRPLPRVASVAFGEDWPLIERLYTLRASAPVGPETWYLWKRTSPH